jgi:hypothetical protein
MTRKAPRRVYRLTKDEPAAERHPGGIVSSQAFAPEHPAWPAFVQSSAAED